MGVVSPGLVYLDGEWDDSQQMAIALRDVGANVPALTQYGTSGIYMPLFDINDLLVFSIQLPHGYQEGTSVWPHVHWIADAIDANTVKWEIDYQWLNPTVDVIAAAPTSVYAEAAPAAAGVTYVTSTTEVTKAAAKISSLFMGNIRRITNGGTDATANIYLAFFDIHFRRDTWGSRQEYVK